MLRALLPGLLLARTAVASKPNLVYVLSDNLGWGNVGYHRARSPAGPSPEVVTPNIDHLVATGIELDRVYTYKFCSPSRSSLLTGRFPLHVNIHNMALDVPGSGIPLGMSTIANKLKTAGYATHAVGKWHCGFATPEQTPTSRGFDSYFGYFGGFNDYLHAWSEMTCPNVASTNHSINYDNSTGADRTKCTSSSVHARHLRSTTDLWEDTHPAHGLNGTGFEEAQFEERVLGIIAGHDPQVHSPLCVPEAFLEKFSFIADADDNVNHDRQYVAAMVNYLDAVVGNVARALQDAGLWNNTLMIWSSDNGGAVELTTGMKNSYPLRGGYTTNWEGGVRADAFVNGGLLPPTVRGTRLAGATSYIHLCDFYATFCGLAGVDPHDELGEMHHLPPVDSLDLWPMLSGRNLTSPRVEILFTPLKSLRPEPPPPDPLPIVPGKPGIPTDPSIPKDMRDPMIIVGEWKLMLGQVDQCWWQGPHYPNGSSTWNTHATYINCTDPATHKKACLFNVIDDETEHHDVSASHPEIVESLLSRMEEVQRTVFDPDRGLRDLQGACKSLEDNGGFWSPWLTPEELPHEMQLQQMAAVVPGLE